MLSLSSFHQYSAQYILSKSLAAFRTTIIETMDSSETGINPVTIINPPKNSGQARGPNQRPVLQSCTLPTELGEICFWKDGKHFWKTFKRRKCSYWNFLLFPRFQNYFSGFFNLGIVWQSYILVICKCCQDGQA